MADNVPVTAGTGTTISTEEITTLNGVGVAAQHVQRIANAVVTSDGIAVDIATGSGTTTTATQRVRIATDQQAVPVSGTFWQATQPVSLASLPALPTGSNVIGGVTQSGTWNITNISGTVSLPTGAATSALQTTGNTSLSNIDADLGAPSDAAWTGTGNATAIAALKAIATAALDTSPATVTPTTLGQTTREYTLSAGLRTAFTATSTTEAALPSLGATRELRICASQRCWLITGATGVSAASAGNTSLPIPADSVEVIRIPSGHTHFRVIRDTADGFIHMAPAA
jgi:hypothetical protein